MAIDVSAVTSVVSDVSVAAAIVGVAVLVLLASIQGFLWLRYLITGETPPGFDDDGEYEYTCDGCGAPISEEMANANGAAGVEGELCSECFCEALDNKLEAAKES